MFVCLCALGKVHRIKYVYRIQRIEYSHIHIKIKAITYNIKAVCNIYPINALIFCLAFHLQ